MADDTTKPASNEITDLALSAKTTREAIDDAKAADPGDAAHQKSRWPDNTKMGIAAGIGIGSAALVAALLYANRGKRKK